MKRTRNFIYSLAIVVLMILLWGTTPPEGSSVGLVVRGVVSLLALYLGFFVERPWERLCEIVVKVVSVCVNVIVTVLDILNKVVIKFVEWSATVSLEDVKKARDEIKTASMWKDDKEKKAINRPVRVLCRWLDLMCVCLFVTLTFSAGMALHYQRLWVVIALNLLGVVSMLLLDTFLCATIDGECGGVVSTSTAVGPLCWAIQEIVLIIQLVLAIIRACLGGDIGKGAFYEPYFTVRLEGLHFTLSPIQMVILVSAMLMLICFANLCSSMHTLAYPLDDEEIEED